MFKPSMKENEKKGARRYKTYLAALEDSEQELKAAYYYDVLDSEEYDCYMPYLEEDEEEECA